MLGISENSLISLLNGEDAIKKLEKENAQLKEELAIQKENQRIYKQKVLEMIEKC